MFAIITYSKTTSTTGDDLSVVNDYIVWFFKDAKRAERRNLYKAKKAGEVGGTGYTKVLLKDGSTTTIKKLGGELPVGAKVFATDNLTSSKPPGNFPVKFKNKTWTPTKGYWKTGEDGMRRLLDAGRIYAGKETLGYIRFLEDFPAFELSNIWTDTVGQNQFGAAGKVYAVQTANIAVQRCMLLATKPGDLILDPTCGSGTTAFVAEQWGRRWITCDTSRVPLALSRQRLLTATFPWYKVHDGGENPSAGFEYKRHMNRKGEEVGGIVPHLKLESIANNEPAKEEVLVDRPEEDESITRIAGPFCFEATIPTPIDIENQPRSETEQAAMETPSQQAGSYADRMIDILRRSPLLRIEGNRTVQLQNIRPLTRTLAGLLEATVAATSEGQAPTLADVVGEAAEANGLLLPGMSRKSVAIVFGPENGSISEGSIYGAAKEATAKDYTHLYCIGFAIEPNARQLIQNCDELMGIPATYVQATMDLNMGDLLKNMRSSQIFSVCGLPEIAVSKLEGGRYQVELLGLDVFDPISMENHHSKGDDVPAWLLDTDYNGMCFHVTQAFFPRTSAWDALKKALKADYEASLWDHLAGSVSAPFEADKNSLIAVKVIDDRGNELMVVKKLNEAAVVVKA